MNFWDRSPVVDNLFSNDHPALVFWNFFRISLDTMLESSKIINYKAVKNLIRAIWHVIQSIPHFYFMRIFNHYFCGQYHLPLSCLWRCSIIFAELYIVLFKVESFSLLNQISICGQKLRSRIKSLYSNFHLQGIIQLTASWIS